MSEHPSYRSRRGRTERTSDEQPAAEEPAIAVTPARRYDRACCCPAPPTVVVVIPPANGRQTDADLLLCSHHYRASMATLAAMGASVVDMNGSQLADDTWPDPT